MRPTTITPLHYHSLEKMLMRLKYYESWRGKIKNQEGFCKEDKEALNLITFIIFKEIMLDEVDDLKALLPYVVRRLYVKSLTWDCKPGNKRFYNNCVDDFDEQLAKSSMKKLLAEASTRKEQKQLQEFVDFLEKESAKLSPKVRRVYKAARAFATLIEYEEVRDELRPDVKELTERNVWLEIEKYNDIPHFYDIVHENGEYANLKKLLTAISWARYTIRWQGYIFHPRCSILAHMLESAIISYYMNMELNRKTDWVHDFSVMMFHDVAEIWTDDIPGPLKDAVVLEKVSDSIKDKVGKETIKLRDIAEIHELVALDENFYPMLPEKLQDFFRDGIMLEDVDDPEVKRFFKMADYFAADYEIWWNICAGIRCKFDRNVLKRSLKEKRTPKQRKVVKTFIRKSFWRKFF